MPNSRHTRWTLALTTACLLLLAALTTSAASASYGELLRFNGKGGASTQHAFNLTEQTQSFGIDPVSGAIFAGDERIGGGGEESEEYRLRRYSPSGTYEAEAAIPTPTFPAGIVEVKGIEGAVVDHGEGRVYVLLRYKRAATPPDEGKEDAGALLAFNIEPSSGKLTPAAGTTTEGSLEGVLASPATLGAGSATAGTALLEPSGIALDPTTHNIVILGQVDQGGVLHQAVQRVTKTGTLGARWVAPAALGVAGGGDSPVVTQSGRILYEEANKILEVPTGFSGAPTTVFRFAQPEGQVEQPFLEEFLTIGESESYNGGALSLFAEGASEGRLVADSEINQSEENGEKSKIRNNGAVSLKYVESGGKLTISEAGWTGAKPGETGVAKSCVVGFGGLGYPTVAAGAEGSILVLAPSTGDVIKFGPTGNFCLPAKQFGTGLELKLSKVKVSNITTAMTVEISAKILQANVLSVDWNFGDGEKLTTHVPSGQQTQTAEVLHKFASTGKKKVEAVIHTDNLATPEIIVTSEVNVLTGIKITLNPTSVTVVEGSGAKFKAAASSEPPPKVQWQQSTDKGSTWTAIPGAESTELALSAVTHAMSGYEYRAVFKTADGSELETTPATLTVETQAEHKAKVEKEEREREERELKEKQEREAAEKAAAEKAAAEKAANERAASERAAAEQAAAEQAAREAAAQQKVLAEKAAFPATSLVGSSFTVSKSGVLVLKISCKAVSTSSCAGSVTLKSLKAISAGVGARQSKAAILTLTTGSFSIGGGQTKTVTVHLSAKAIKALKKAKSLGARATIVAHNPEGAVSNSTATLTLKAGKH